MRQNRWLEVVGALVLIGAGLLLLLQNAGLLPDVVPVLWSALFLGEGALFLAGFFTSRSQWWALIPASALAGVGIAVLVGGALHLPGELAGGGFFAVLALGFAGVYLVQRRENWWALIPAGGTAGLAGVTLLSGVAGELAAAVFFAVLGLLFVGLYFAEIDGRRYNWWALIPAGALLSLAAVIVLSAYDPGASGAALFLGLGATFGVLYLLRRPERPLGWAWIPALALLAFGVFILAVAGESFYARLFWPLALVVGGLVLLQRSWRRPGVS